MSGIWGSRFPDYYDVMVGGAVDVGESYEEAAVREPAEELGVRVPVRFLFEFLASRTSGFRTEMRSPPATHCPCW
ncbi:NUDIX domain-containing protein [Nonomuraea sp. K274]|uniref:NUDIX domain-containing protein n=1 Tax=Nonomuraea cypriaca TaxID=1187855 RepID=A0A931A3D4_9ACTN|nr:NUDIX domain-containing protein [Nonomuraea cypriaca]